MKEIAKGIKESVHLKCIDLRHNLFEKEGLHALINALKNTMTCEILKLEGIFIDMEDADKLVSFLTHKDCHIKELELHDADMNFEVFEKVNQGLSKCKQLESISFSKNILGDALCYEDSEGDSDIEDKVGHDGGRMQELAKKREMKRSRETE